MARSKENKHANGIKRELDENPVPVKPADARPSKKVKLLDDSDEGSDAEEGGVTLKVNEEYARRFEYNKKREEKHRLEEKYGKGKALEDAEDDSEDSEEGVEEDDAGEFATEALDNEIFATLNALRSKDPRIYDKDAKFFREPEEDQEDGESKENKEQSMTLKQYHTKNLLEGNFAADEEDAPPRTYAEEQEEVRRNLVKELHAAEDSSEENDDFLVAKSKPVAPKERVKLTAQDVEKADQDPETFLSNFMASRAWVPVASSHFQPLESDDENEEAAAEEWENSYNMYFEDITGANEKLVTYARDAVASTTVRRDDATGRRKAREAARAKREAERKERETELARLRKLKIDEMEQKVKKIRKTGGLTGRDFKMDEWKAVLEGDWSDDQWDAEMQKRFGDSYYAEDDALSGSDAEGKKRKKPKKPKFDDDIDIKDLVPDFKDDEEEKPEFTLSSDEEADSEDQMDVDDEEEEKKTTKSSKQRKQERAEAKSAARRDRRLIENLVDSNLEYEAALVSKGKAPTRFRYRETSPTTFGLTARDILLADDTQLNEFAGLKKLASFRDPVKKKKDKKHLSKKARLRQWRLDTFGDAEGPKGGFETVIGDEVGPANGESNKPTTREESNIVGGEGSRKKKRSRKRKTASAEA